MGFLDLKGDGATVLEAPGKGWFPIFRFYGPLESLFDKTWKLPDIEEVQ
jgi:hypothetical protein